MTWLSDDAVAHLRAVAEIPDLSGTRYRIEREIGRGGMGVVYEAEDVELERRVAIKVLASELASDDAVERMRAEARTMARLEHPGIVPLHDVGLLADGRLWYAMKLVRGRRLDALQAMPAELLRVFLRICEAVSFAHANGIVHCDLKPENVMLGDFGEVLVMDWGVARAAGVITNSPVAGTRGFMAPEQEQGLPAIDASTDVFALGALLRAILPKLPRPLAAVCAKATAPVQRDRYATARAGGRRVTMARRTAGLRLPGEPLRARRPVARPQPRTGYDHRRLSVHAPDRLPLDSPLKDFGQTLNTIVGGNNMNKILVGLLLGAALGAVDGMTAWFTPAVRAGIIGIVIGSTVKGMIAGIAAGWFARKVQSVAWGIAFGLLIGGLLAYGVAAMQHGYYFEIMLPGSIVGAIVGWATQRYGRPVRGTAGASLAAFFLVMLTVSARAAEPVKAADAFAHLKALAGTWNGHAMSADGPPASVSYRLTAGGTAVMETLFGGTEHEMLTIYTLNGNDVVATHFCAAGNQPIMKLDKSQSAPDRLVFSFVSVGGDHANDHPHVHNGVLHFVGNDQLEASWAMQTAEGGPFEHSPKFFLTRGK